MSTADRLADLEARVATLEDQLSAPAPTGPNARSAGRAARTSGRTPNPDVFWALEGLQARVEEPGAVMLVGDVRLPDGRVARWQLAEGTTVLLGEGWEEEATTLAALGHPVRLRLLQQVLSGVTTAQELTRTDGLGTSGQVYHHLRQLAAAGWLRSRGGGHYEVPVARVVPLLVLVLGARR